MNNFLKLFALLNIAALGWHVGGRLSDGTLAVLLVLLFLGLTVGLPMTIVALSRGDTAHHIHTHQIERQKPPALPTQPTRMLSEPRRWHVERTGDLMLPVQQYPSFMREDVQPQRWHVVETPKQIEVSR